jgi:hypothetical protein
LKSGSLKLLEPSVPVQACNVVGFVNLRLKKQIQPGSKSQLFV